MHEPADVIAPEKEKATTPQWCADDARQVTIIVVIKDATGSGDIYLQSDPNSGGVPIVQDYIAEFNNNQGGVYSNGFLVSFSLPADQGQNANWTFDDDPIWTKLVDKHGSCPRNKNDNNPNILQDPTLSADKRTLTVGNANASVEYFGFALRFSSTVGGKTLTYDPIGSNQNGSSID